MIFWLICWYKVLFKRCLCCVCLPEPELEDSERWSTERKWIHQSPHCCPVHRHINNSFLTPDLYWSTALQGSSYLPTQKKVQMQTRISSDWHRMGLYQTGEFKLTWCNCFRVTGWLNISQHALERRQPNCQSITLHHTHSTVWQSLIFTPLGDLIKSWFNLSCMLIEFGNARETGVKLKGTDILGSTLTLNV